MRSQHLLTTTLLAFATGLATCSVAAATPVPQGLSIRADVNRDGTVDLNGTSDENGKNTATVQAGALFLPNLDDDGGRCGTDERCNDATDNVVNGPDDEKDLALIKTVPGYNAGATITITAGGQYVRLFSRTGGAWTEVTPSTRFTAEQLQAGLTLGLEGKDIVRGNSWDGVATISIAAGNDRDTVSLHVAPMVTHNHTQVSQQLLSAPDVAKFGTDLAAAARNANMPNPLYLFPGSTDKWAQDWQEPGFASIPSPNGVQSLRLLLRSDQDRAMQQKLYALRGTGTNIGVINMRQPFVGRVELPEPKAELQRRNSRSSFGNLETIPPHGNYPAGRIIMGQASFDPPTALTLKTLRAQGLQEPLLLDTNWLGVGHVDEFIQFLPANNAAKFKIAIADPNLAVEVMKKAAQNGGGNVKINSSGQGGPTMTVNTFLKDRTAQNDVATAWQNINANLQLVLRETGLTEADVVHIPVLYTTANYLRNSNAADQVNAAVPYGASKAPLSRDELTRLRPGPAMSSLLPAAINSIVASPTHMIVAQQFGPIVGGRDVMADAVTAAYGSAGFQVSFVDDYRTYHLQHGEVHCASNSFRITTTPWWRF